MSDLTKLESAFPLQVAKNVTSTVHLGMTLRDWFAGQALAGILGNPNIDNSRFEVDAGVAYAAADAMLAARAKTEDKQ